MNNLRKINGILFFISFDKPNNLIEGVGKRV
jgi:hypothetical protein